ncbi:MAG: helix-turn-helix domain-containing protein, partial [Bacteroidota bacterium]
MFTSMKADPKQLSELSTEERILAVAAKVFTEKGYEATKTRDIAEAAGINIASLHYYFRSKEKLFDIVIGKTMVKFSKLMGEVMNT